MDNTDWHPVTQAIGTQLIAIIAFPFILLFGVMLGIVVLLPLAVVAAICTFIPEWFINIAGGILLGLTCPACTIGIFHYLTHDRPESRDFCSFFAAALFLGIIFACIDYPRHGPLPEFLALRFALVSTFVSGCLTSYRPPPRRRPIRYWDPNCTIYADTDPDTQDIS